MTYRKIILEVTEDCGLLPVKIFLGFEHASDDIFSVLVKPLPNIIHVNTPDRIVAVQVILQTRLANNLG